MTLVVTTLVSWLAGFSGEVVGEIPRGLPRLLLPDIDATVLTQLFVGALTLTMLGLMEAMAIAKTLAARTRQHLDINQELIGQGMANVIGGFFQSYATSGSFSRSAVNHQSGARTGFASVVTSLVIAATLLWLTPLLYYLPQATLAVVIIAAVGGLVRIQPLVTAWRIRAFDGLIGAGDVCWYADFGTGSALGGWPWGRGFAGAQLLPHHAAPRGFSRPAPRRYAARERRGAEAGSAARDYAL